MPPGYPEAKRAMESMAPPQGSTPLPAPHAQLLGVHAEGLGEAAPGEAAGLLQAFEALTEVVRQDAALQGLGPVRSVVVVPVETSRVVSLVHLSPPI